MKSWVNKLAAVLIAIYLLANSSWIYAASHHLVSTPCDNQLMSTAQTRVAELFGSVTSTPLFACSSDPGNWLNVEYGQTSFALGLPAAIRIGPKGMNVDVIAHEWAHAELFERVGFFSRELTIPTWFDEGLAMQVDHRRDYGLVALEKYTTNLSLRTPKMSLIETSDFFTEGTQGKYHYALSRCLVEFWVQNNDQYRSELENIQSATLDSIYANGIAVCNRS